MGYISETPYFATIGFTLSQLGTSVTGHETDSVFLDFFAARGHRVVRSSSLVPANDPTLLFANAGMNQFKDTFLGLEKRAYSRATSTQKCVRAGGKHKRPRERRLTRRHHTFSRCSAIFSSAIFQGPRR